MTDSKIPVALHLRDRWPLLPESFARVVLDVFDAAFDRRPPFDTVERSAFDIALGKIPPPRGLTREQFRRGVFEEMNYLPWSDGLEPPDGGSWIRHVPVRTGQDRIFTIPREPYRLTRKVAKRVVDGMRSDGLLGPRVDVEINGGLDLLIPKTGSLGLYADVSVSYGVMPHVQGSLSVLYPGSWQCIIRPQNIFLDPNLGDMTSDEEAEYVIRQMWRYTDALSRALSDRFEHWSSAA
jgi:hypothetical protein